MHCLVRTAGLLSYADPSGIPAVRLTDGDNPPKTDLPMGTTPGRGTSEAWGVTRPPLPGTDVPLPAQLSQLNFPGYTPHL